MTPKHNPVTTTLDPVQLLRVQEFRAQLEERQKAQGIVGDISLSMALRTLVVRALNAEDNGNE